MSDTSYWDTWMGSPQFGKGMQAFGIGYSTAAAYTQASTQRGVMGYQAAVARNNAAMAGYQADVAQQVGANEEQQSMLRTSHVYGAQRAAMAANGVDLGEGSANEVLTSTAYMGERDAMTIKQNTAQRVWALKNEQANYQYESDVDQAVSNSINPRLSAFGTFLGGGTMYARSWYGRR